MFSSNAMMKKALELAVKASQEGEVPVGAIITDNKNNILASTHNKVEQNADVTQHAEMIAISEASKKTGNKFLNGCTLYVTLEPCPMCAQAISNARISKVVFGAEDEKSGGVINGARIYESTSCHHKPEVISGVMSDECSSLMKDFFKSKR